MTKNEKKLIDNITKNPILENDYSCPQSYGDDNDYKSIYYKVVVYFD